MITTIRAIYKRQLAAWFYSGTAYITAAAFLLVSGLSFCYLVTRSMEERLTLGDILFGSVFFWCMLIVAVALITMNVFSEERKTGTLEMLLTAPVTDQQVTLAKYGAALTCLIATLAPTLLYIPLLNRLCLSPLNIDLVPLVGGFAIMLIIAASYTAFGVMVSAVTRSPVAAACISMVGLSLAFFTEIFRLGLSTGRLAAIIEHLAPTWHVMDFSQGVIDTRPLILYFSSTIFCLFVTVKSLESRHWR